MSRVVILICTMALAASLAACGKKGPPVLKEYGGRNGRTAGEQVEK